MVIAATLLIANNKLGGYLIAFVVLLQALTVDNPILQTSDTNSEYATQNMFKDFGIMAAALLTALKSKKVIHRKSRT